jgi:hypothetical protein
LLQQKIASLVRRIFGAKSEKIDPKQLGLLLQLQQEVRERRKQQAPVAAGAIPCKDQSRQSRGKRKQPRWPVDIPVAEEVIDPEPVKAAPESWRLIGAEVSAQLDYEPARFLCRRLIRRKYVPRNNAEDGVPIIAPLPEESAGTLHCRSGTFGADPHQQIRRSSAFVSATTNPIRAAMVFTCRAKAWHAGSGWLPTGCGPSMSKSARA